MTDTFPVLYILMRNDLASMNAGKAMAQASHASNAFVDQMSQEEDKFEGYSTNPDDDADLKLFWKWRTETEQGFGTVLVLAVNEAQMRTAVEVAGAMGFVSGVVHDPTYPLRDGDTTHFLPVDTCSFIFGDKNDPMLGAVVGNFPLHP